MSEETTTNQSHSTMARRRVSRARLLAAAGAGAALATLPRATLAAGSAPRSEFPFYPQIQGRYQPESVQEIVSNILTFLTFETAAATFILNTPAALSALGLTGLPLAFLQGMNAEWQYQRDFWSSAVPAAAPGTTTFTLDVPALAAGGAKGALAIFEAAASLRTGMFIAAVREFAELGQPTLAKYAAQSLGLQADERAISRTFQALAGVPGSVPPNNKAFETDLVLYTRDAIGILGGLGFIGGPGAAVPYPGRDAVLAASGATVAAVSQKAPNNATTTVAITGLGSLTAER